MLQQFARLMFGSAGTPSLQEPGKKNTKSTHLALHSSPPYVSYLTVAQGDPALVDGCVEPGSRDEAGSHASARMEGVGTRKTEIGLVVGVKCAWITSLSLGLALSSAAHGSFLDPFEYAGSEGSPLGLMRNEAGNGQGGASVFAGAGFGSNMVNVFLANLSNATSGLSNAGLPLSVIRGGGVDLRSEYSASVSITDMFDVGEDGSFTAGLSEIFAAGEGVSIVDGFVGLAGNGTVQEVRLFNYDEHTAQASFNGISPYGPYIIGTEPLIVPLPPPLGLALAGLIGVVLFRRRLSS